MAIRTIIVEPKPEPKRPMPAERDAALTVGSQAIMALSVERYIAEQRAARAAYMREYRAKVKAKR